MCGWLSDEARRASRRQRSSVSDVTEPSRELERQNLESDLTPEAEILRAIDDAHAACAEALEDFVVSDRGADRCCVSDFVRNHERRSIPAILAGQQTIGFVITDDLLGCRIDAQRPAQAV